MCRRTSLRRLNAVLVAALVAAAVTGPIVAGAHGATAGAAALRRCRAERNATAVLAGGVNCTVAAGAISTYETAPRGCINHPRCVQSGLDQANRVLIVDCARHGLSLGCAVYVKSRTGRTVDPRIAGVVIRGRFVGGSVRFRMRRDPYG